MNAINAQRQRKVAIDIQLNIMYHKRELKKNPNCKVSKLMLRRDRDRLKEHIYAKTS